MDLSIVLRIWGPNKIFIEKKIGKEYTCLSHYQENIKTPPIEPLFPPTYDFFCAPCMHFLTLSYYFLANSTHLANFGPQKWSNRDFFYLIKWLNNNFGLLLYKFLADVRQLRMFLANYLQIPLPSIGPLSPHVKPWRFKLPLCTLLQVVWI